MVYGLLTDAMMSMHRPFAMMFLERLGGGSIHMTLFNSLPGIVAVVVLFPSSLILTKFKYKKKITSIFILIARIIVLLMAFIPLLPVYMRPMMFVLFISMKNLPESISQMSMQSFIGTIFNGEERAKALSLRGKFANIFILIITLVTGLVLSYLPRDDEQIIYFYQLFFVIAAIIGVFEVIQFRRLKEKPAEAEATEKLEIRKNIKAVFRDKKFMLFAISTLIFYFSFHSGWALSSIYIITELGATEIWLTLNAIASGVASFLFAGWWNRLINKKGNDFALVLACFGMGLNTLFIVLSPNLYFIMVQTFFNGIIGVGIGITLLNGLLAATPDKNRIIYIGIYNTLMNVSLGIAPLVTQVILDERGARFALYTVASMRFVAVGILILALFVVKKKILGKTAKI